MFYFVWHTRGTGRQQGIPTLTHHIADNSETSDSKSLSDNERHNDTDGQAARRGQLDPSICKRKEEHAAVDEELQVMFKLVQGRMEVLFVAAAVVSASALLSIGYSRGTIFPKHTPTLFVLSSQSG